MIPKLEMLNISKDIIDLDKNDFFKQTVAEWLFDDVEDTRLKSERSSSIAESSSATASTSNCALKEENTPPVNLSSKRLSNHAYRSLCSGEAYHQIGVTKDEHPSEQEQREDQHELLPSLRVTKEPIRCQWSMKKKRRCGRSFHTAEALTRHVFSEHIEEVQRARDDKGRECNWGICSENAFDLQKHIMEEHLAIHAFACPYEKCKSIGGPPKSFAALQAHVKKYHSKKDIMRALFMPSTVVTTGSSQRIPDSFPAYLLDQQIIRSPRRNRPRRFDNHQTAIAQLTPSFSQEAKRSFVQPWKDGNFTKLQDGVKLTDAYALDDGRKIGKHDTWEVSLATVIPKVASTSSNNRPKKLTRQ